MKDRLKRILECHQGRHSAITRRELRHLLELDIKEDRALRLTIAELRAEGFPILFATSFPQGYYLPESLKELREGMDKLRSYIIEECIVLRNYKVLGSQYLAGEKQGMLI